MIITSNINNQFDHISAYLTFVSGRTGNELDAALCKNLDKNIYNIGYALAMYAKYKDPSISIDLNYPNLSQCHNLNNIVSPLASPLYLEVMSDDIIRDFLLSNSYWSSKLAASTELILEAKRNSTLMEIIMKIPFIVDGVRSNEEYRALFNKNRIRILAPGDISWTVPEDWPTDFIHIQLVGGGGIGTSTSAGGKCGEYVQGVIKVKPGDVITGNIGTPGTAGVAAGNVSFGGITALAGVGAEQSGAFLVKATNGLGETYSCYGNGGFEGGSGGTSTGSRTSALEGGIGDGTLGTCEGTGGSAGNQAGAGSDGGGGGGSTHQGSKNYSRVSGGGGFGGGAAFSHGGTPGGGGSGAIIITCPDGYIPQFVVYNTIDGITAWRRDENIFNDFDETV